MARYAIQTRRDVYTTDVTINDKTFSGWYAQNTGASDAKVMGITLKAGDTLDMTGLCRPDVVWTGPLQIEASGTSVVLVRIQYNKKEY